MKKFSARLIHDLEPKSGSFNMAADDVLSRYRFSSDTNMIVRVYRFDPPAVSLGRNQNLEEVNQSACFRKGWDIVRRPTGGRSLLHLNDICYSVIIPRLDDVLKELKNLYQSVASSLTFTFLSLGIDASKSDSLVEFPLDSEVRKSRLCIGARVRGEVHYMGRKLTSASQRIYKDSILQHGSIFIGGDQTVVADVVPGKNMEDSEFVEKLRGRVTTVEEALGESLSIQKFLSVFEDRLGRQFDVNLDDSPLDGSELKAIASSQNLFSLAPVPQNISAA